MIGRRVGCTALLSKFPNRALTCATRGVTPPFVFGLSWLELLENRFLG